MKLTTAACVMVIGLVALSAGPAIADVAGPTFTLRVGGVAGEPMLLDSTIGFGSYNPSAGSGDLAVNSDTGIVYGIDTTSSGIETARMDPSFEYEKGQASVNAGTGTTRTYTTGYHFAGTVAGATDLGNSAMRMGLSYDPYMLTNGNAGVITQTSSGGAPHWEEYIAQTGAQALGALNEGTVASPSNTSARVTTVTLQNSIGSLGDAGHWNGLAVDIFKGQFTPSNDDAIGSTVSRYFFGIGDAGSGNFFKSVYVVHVNATRSAEPTATTVGTREAYFRDNSSAQALVLTHAQFEGLVPAIADLGEDMAVDPVNGDLYFLSSTGANGAAYLSAIRPTISNDSDVAISYDVVDLDLSDNGGLPGGNTYLTLSSLHGDLAAGMGLAFNADGSRLYITVVPHTGITGEVNAIYALDITRAAVPEPATLGLLAVGGLALGGLSLRRRHRA